MPIILKSGRLNLLEPSGPVQACNGIALPFLAYTIAAMLLSSRQRDRQCSTYNVTIWRIRVTIVVVETKTMLSVSVFELHVTVNYINILSVAQQCFYD